MEKIIKIIREDMVRLGLSARKLSDEAGLKDTYIKDILSGKSKNPDFGNMVKLASYLGRPIEDFYSENELREKAGSGFSGFSIQKKNTAMDNAAYAGVVAKGALEEMGMTAGKANIAALAKKLCELEEIVGDKAMSHEMAVWLIKHHK